MPSTALISHRNESMHFMALWNKTIFHQCCSTARRCSLWSSHSHENSTSRPHQNHQDFIARIHGTCIATVCMHQPCLVQGFILTTSHASVRQSKNKVSALSKSVRNNKLRASKGSPWSLLCCYQISNLSRWCRKQQPLQVGFWSLACLMQVRLRFIYFNSSQFPFSRSVHEQQSFIQISIQSWFN